MKCEPQIRKRLLLLFLILTPVIGHGQVKISGRIVDFKSSEPMASITILNQSDSTLFRTDISGKFELVLSQSDTLIKLISIGYGYTILNNIKTLSDPLISLGNVPVFEYYTTGGTYEYGNKKNFFGKEKRKQAIVHYDLIIYDSIGQDGLLKWYNGQKEVSLIKQSNSLYLDVTLLNETP
ncbi:hypothetical protein [Chondrinema litorale]|uniref:hypothetical protein n=1 Tax=Chondrinema litorale TaxID=2994555 RepID=UPI002542C061|nr:hypothetical protein [Chondrinema litorale]UZR98534.1 hypothetical protein OQ292_31520 [Chondrinema litorale]